MPQVEQSIEIYQNAVEIIVIAITDEHDNPVNLTTFDELCWTFSGLTGEIARYTTADPELVIVDADDTNDGMRITLPASLTAGLSCGRLYTHQAWGTFNLNPRPLCVGYVTVLRGDGC